MKLQRHCPVRPKERFLVFGAPSIEQPEIDEVIATLRGGWIGTGPRVARFESDFAQYKNAHHAVAVNSCTAALHLSLIALDLHPGDEVITTPLTFCATANAILHAGGRPVLADVDPATMNIDAREVEAKISPRTRAILPVHFAGRPCEMNELVALSEKHGLEIVEDCAHAIETEYRGQKAGTFGAFGCFSFYVTKNVSTGEGGMVLTSSEKHATRIKALALHGMSADAWSRFSDQGHAHYYTIEAGFKYNMTDIQAALGIHQLRRVEKNWHRRRGLWEYYDENLGDLPITTPARPAIDSRHGYHLYTILVNRERAGISRDCFIANMHRENIGVGVHYQCLGVHPYFQKTLGWRQEDTPQAAKIGQETVSLPLSPALGDEDARDVIQAIRKVLHA